MECFFFLLLDEFEAVAHSQETRVEVEYTRSLMGFHKLEFKHRTSYPGAFGNGLISQTIQGYQMRSCDTWIFNSNLITTNLRRRDVDLQK